MGNTCGPSLFEGRGVGVGGGGVINKTTVLIQLDLISSRPKMIIIKIIFIIIIHADIASMEGDGDFIEDRDDRAR